MKDYHINIFYSDEDQCYVANIPDLVFCSAFGKTPEEALREVQVAKELWLEVARETDKPIPEPRYKPREVNLGRMKKSPLARTTRSKPHRARR